MNVAFSEDPNPTSPHAGPCTHHDHPRPAVPGVALHWCDERAEIHRIVVGDYENNVFVLRCRQTGQSVLNVQSVLETHGHFDHIQAVPAVRAAGYRVAVTAPDAAMLPSYDDVLEDESVLEVGRLRLHAICTPGHTPGSVCFRLEDSPVLFSGDTLFPGGPGTTTFDGGDFTTIISSIDRRLFASLDPGTIVMPGHGLDTTIGTEMPNLDTWVARGW